MRVPQAPWAKTHGNDVLLKRGLRDKEREREGERDRGREREREREGGREGGRNEQQNAIQPDAKRGLLELSPPKRDEESATPMAGVIKRVGEFCV